MLEAAIAAGGANGRQALLLGTLANELTYSGDFDRRRRARRRRAARQPGRAATPRCYLQVINLVFYPLWVPETLDERLALTEESLALVAQVDDPASPSSGPRDGSNYLNLVQAGPRRRERPLPARRSDELADQLAQPALQWRARHIAATRRLLAGDPDARGGARATKASSSATSAGEAEASVYFKSQEMCVHWQRGTMAELSARIKGTSPRPPNAVASLCLIFCRERARRRGAGAARPRRPTWPSPTCPTTRRYITSVALFAEAAILTCATRGGGLALRHPRSRSRRRSASTA